MSVHLVQFSFDLTDKPLIAALTKFDHAATIQNSFTEVGLPTGWQLGHFALSPI